MNILPDATDKFVGARLPRPCLMFVMYGLYNTGMNRILLTSIGLMLLATTVFAFDGFQNAEWGATPDAVKKANNPASWTVQPASTEFPKELNVSVVIASQQIAGRNASVKYYFYNNKFFQATVRFNFDNLKNFDFNYNVYRSVDGYYKAIRDQTVSFVFDIYDLLQKKYGKKQPIFEKLDPRFMFTDLDRYLKKEAWNLRYYPVRVLQENHRRRLCAVGPPENEDTLFRQYLRDGKTLRLSPFPYFARAVTERRRRT